MSTFPYDWKKRCPLTVQSSEVSADVNLHLLLTEDCLPADVFKYAEKSIRFSSDISGLEQIAFEIVQFDTVNSKAEIYIPVDIKSAVDVTIYLWFDCVNCAALTNAETVLLLWQMITNWNSTYSIGSWPLVIHGDDNGTDKVFNSVNETEAWADSLFAKKEANGPLEVAGDYGKAQDFDAANEDYLHLDVDSIGRMGLVQGPIAYGHYLTMRIKRTRDSVQEYLWCLYEDATYTADLYINSSDKLVFSAVFKNAAGVATTWTCTSTSSIADTAWHTVGFRLADTNSNSGPMELYIDGALEDSLTITTGFYTTTIYGDIIIGAKYAAGPTYSDFFDGLIKSIRSTFWQETTVTDTGEITAAYILEDHINKSDPGAYTIAGAVTDIPSVPTFEVLVEGTSVFHFSDYGDSLLEDTGENHVTGVANSVSEYSSQKFTAPITGTIKKLTVWLRAFGTPTQSISFVLLDTNFESGQVGAQIFELAPDEGELQLDITSDDWLITKDEIYYITILYPPDATNYYALINESNVGDLNSIDTNASAYTKVTGTWVENTDHASIKMNMWINGEFDISDLVTEIEIDTGKNEFDGDFIENTCDISLIGMLPMFREQGYQEEYSVIREYNKITVNAVYFEITYPQFKGFITETEPIYGVGASLNISCTDNFDWLKNVEVTVTGSGDTASELIQKVMTALTTAEPLWTSADYEINAHGDNYVLTNKTWTKETAFDILKEIVEVGYHHHFCDGTGKYIFHSNQWNSSGMPEDTWEETEVDAYSVEKSSDTILNYAEVAYGSLFANATNADSKELYRLRTVKHEGDLLPNDVNYATALAAFIVTVFGEPLSGATVELYNRYIQSLKYDLGALIQSSWEAMYINSLRSIVGKNLTMDANNEFNCTLKMAKFVTPVALAVSQEYEWISTRDYINVGFFAFSCPYGVWTDTQLYWQGFTVPASHSGDLTKIRFRAVYQKSEASSVDVSAVCNIYAADVNGEPTGAILGTSDAIAFSMSNSWVSAFLDFIFPEGDRAAMVSSTEYVAHITYSIVSGYNNHGEIKHEGARTDEYSGGKTGYGPVGSTTIVAGIEFWGRTFIE